MGSRVCDVEAFWKVYVVNLRYANKKVAHECMLLGEDKVRSYTFKCRINQLSFLYCNDEFGKRSTAFCEFAERPAEADLEGFMA